MYTDDREAYRNMFFMAWQKYQKNMPAEGIEASLIDIIKQHPEYHMLLSNPKKGQQLEFTVEENPFLHMSLHLALLEQIGMDRPASIAGIYENLTKKHGEAHLAQHEMMTCLASVMWEAQHQGIAPDEQIYMVKLQGLL